MDVRDMGVIKTKDVEVEAFEVIVPAKKESGTTVQLKKAGSQ